MRVLGVETMQTTCTSVATEPSGSSASQSTRGNNPGYKILSKATAGRGRKTIPTGTLGASNGTIVKNRSSAGTLTWRHSGFNDLTRTIDPDWENEFREISKEIFDASYRRPTRNPTKKELQLAA